MTSQELVFTMRADTDDLDRQLKRIRREVRTISLAAHLTLAIVFAVAFVAGLALGIAVAS